MLVLGVGLGLTMQVLILAAQNAVPYSYLGVATSAATLFRSIGGSLGTAILGADLRQPPRPRAGREGAADSPAAAGLDAGQIDPSQVQSLPPALHDGYISSFTDSISTVFLIAAAVVLVAFVLAWMLEEKPLRKTVETSDVGDAFAAPRDTDSLREITRELSRLVGRERTRRFLESVAERADDAAEPGRGLAARPGRRRPRPAERDRGADAGGPRAAARGARRPAPPRAGLPIRRPARPATAASSSPTSGREVLGRLITRAPSACTSSSPTGRPRTPSSTRRSSASPASSARSSPHTPERRAGD